MSGDDEDGLSEAVQGEIEREIQSTKRKRYLGPESIHEIPSTSRARFSATTIQSLVMHPTVNKDIPLELDLHPPEQSLVPEPEHTDADSRQDDENLQAPPHSTNEDHDPDLCYEGQYRLDHKDSTSSRSSSSSHSPISPPSLSMSDDSDNDNDSTVNEEQFNEATSEMRHSCEEGSSHHDRHDEGQRDMVVDGNQGPLVEANVPLDGDNNGAPADHADIPDIPVIANDGNGQAAGNGLDFPGDGNAPRNLERNHQKLREAIVGGFLNNIDIPVTASRADLLYMALGLASKDKNSNTAFCHLINLLNAIFASPVLPATKHLLDELLVCNIGVNYHFYCENCFKCFGEVDYKNVKNLVCDNCNLRNNVSDLRRASYFVMFNLPLQLEILLNKPTLADALASPVEACQRTPPGVFSDICSGSVYREFAASTRNFLERIISFHFFVDGAPLATSSNSSIWPIQLALNELPPEERMKSTLLGGLWFGKKQPPMHLFLFPFVSHMRELGDGFQLKVGNEVWNTRTYCIGCSADSGARGLVQGVKSHGGYSACNWCKITGEYIAKAVRYPMTLEEPADRNHEEMVRLQRSLVENPPEQDMSDNEEEEIPRNQEMFGVKSVSPLINLPRFDMVEGFLFESMHCVDLGIVKAFLSLCLEDAGEPYYIKASTPELNNRIRDLKVPIEFRRMPRIFKERLKWKAREYNNFLLLSVPILKGILPDKYLKTWMLFVQAICLLNQTTVTLEQIDKAERIVTQFLAESQVHYGQQNMSFNLHILRHIGAHVSRWGPLWATSAYSFESGNGHLKNIIHSVEGVPHQIIRNFSWDMAKNLLEPAASPKAKEYVANIEKPKRQHQINLHTASSTLIGKPKEFHLSDEEKYLCELHNHDIDNILSFQKLVYDKCLYVVDSKISARTSNSVAQLKDNTIALIKNIFYDQDLDKVFLFVLNLNWNPLFTFPREFQLQRHELFLRQVTSVGEELRYIPCEDLKIICVRTKISDVDFLAPLPNIHSRF